MVAYKPDNHYSNRLLASVYDAANGWSEDSDFYLSLADKPGLDVLDIGCGTGLLCNAYAAGGHRVVGVDPADAMLQEARKKKYADNVVWMCACAQEFQCDRQFDLIVMTGHAFQTLLTDNDVMALLGNVRRYLKAHGLFAFESRNPAYDWRNLWHRSQCRYDSQAGPVRHAIAVQSANADYITFETKYELEVATLSSQSTLRFLSAPVIRRMIRDAGLTVKQVYGSWDRTPHSHNDKEMIFTVGT